MKVPRIFIELFLNIAVEDIKFLFPVLYCTQNQMELPDEDWKYIFSIAFCGFLLFHLL